MVWPGGGLGPINVNDLYEGLRNYGGYALGGAGGAGLGWLNPFAGALTTAVGNIASGLDYTSRLEDAWKHAQNVYTATTPGIPYKDPSRTTTTSKRKRRRKVGTNMRLRHKRRYWYPYPDKKKRWEQVGEPKQTGPWWVGFKRKPLTKWGKTPKYKRRRSFRKFRKRRK